MTESSNPRTEGVCTFQGVFLDANGNVAEGPNMNVAIITEDGTFVVRRDCTQQLGEASAS